MDIPQERKLVTEIPGPRSREWFERRDNAVPRGVANIHPIVTARASGAIVEDVDGNRLIDFATGIAVLNVGHTAPEVVAAAQRQLELDTHTCFHVTANEPYIELAERLNTLAPGDHEKKTMFANSGAEAVENAVKIARKHTGRAGVVVFDHAFHGRTLMAMSLTAKVMPYKQGMGPFAPEIYRLPLAYPYRCPTGGTEQTCAESCLAYALDEMHKHIGEENIAAILIEPIQGEGGFIVPASGFIAGLAEFAAANGIVFIADEIQSGMGRAGRWFAIEDEGVVPDIVLSAKSLGGGLPISAVTGRADLMDSVHVGGLGGRTAGTLSRRPRRSPCSTRSRPRDCWSGPAPWARRSTGGCGRCRSGSARSATCAGAGRCGRWSSSPTAPRRSRSMGRSCRPSEAQRWNGA